MPNSLKNIPNPFFEEWLESQNPEFQDIILDIRETILFSFPNLVESFKWSIPFYSFKGDVCYIHPSKKVVNLGFVKGILLPNHENLLTGKGKQVRHINFYRTNQYEPEQIIKNLEAAIGLNEKNIKLTRF